MNENIIAKLFPKALENIKQGLCPLCGNHVNLQDFRDQQSRKEYEISKMCQSCQDKIFG